METAPVLPAGSQANDQAASPSGCNAGAAGPRPLSARELQVLDLLAQGCYYREISDRLEISYATVHTHVRHIYRKFQVHSRGRAVAKFLDDQSRCSAFS